MHTTRSKPSNTIQPKQEQVQAEAETIGMKTIRKNGTETTREKEKSKKTERNISPGKMN